MAMLDSCSKELDLAYMPYHEGLVNHKAPPVRGSLSVRVSHHQPQHVQQSLYYGDSDDDDVSDDPAWMNAPRGSLQPAFPPSLMKKASTWSATDSQTSSRVSDPICSAGEEEEAHKDKKDDDKDDDDFLSTMPTRQSEASWEKKNSKDGRGSLNNVDDKLTMDLKPRKSVSTSPTHQALAKSTTSNNMVNLNVPKISSGKSEMGRLSVEQKKSDPPTKCSTSPISVAVGGGNNGFRESTMRCRPTDLKQRDPMKAMISRDSLAPENFESSTGLRASTRSSNMAISNGHRSSNVLDSGRSLDPFGSSRGMDPMSGRGSVIHFGPRVTEEGLSNYLRAVKSGNLQLLRACLEDRNTNFTERDPVHGQSAMHIAVRFGQLHAVQLLCGKKTRGLLIDAVDKRRNTPLHLASAKSRRITKYLLEHGADASRVNNRNQTPLAVHILTTKRDDPLIAEMLLQHKTDPNGPVGNSTLLHKAVDLKFYEIAYRLVRHGARLDAKDPQGRMVFDKVDPKILRQLCGKIVYPPVWVSNTERKSCMSCLRNFGPLGLGVRRHHCRHCGRLVCGRCSHVSVECEAFPTAFVGQIDRNPSDERSNLKRVCKTCSSVFDERAKLAKASSRGGSGKWSEAFMDRVVGFAWDEIEKKDDASNLGSSRRRSLAA